MGVFMIRALLFGVHVGAAAFGKLPHEFGVLARKCRPAPGS